MDNQNSKLPTFSFDAFIPPQMAERAEKTGVQKTAMGWRTMIALGVLAGGFISMGAVFSTTVTAGATGHLSYGVSRLLGGLVFSLGLILVVVAGAELFTGNNLIIMAWAHGRVTTAQVLRNWLLVYVGNFLGAISTAVLMYISSQYHFGKGTVGINLLNTAAGKCQLGFIQAIALGIACNALVCMAVWMCYSARTTTDKILSVIFPITAFVAAGFEHSIANMYFIPIALFVKSGAPSMFWETIGKTASDFADLTWTNFIFTNLLPVTIGNIFGGAVMVGLIYWFIYLRKGNVAKTKPSS